MPRGTQADVKLADLQIDFLWKVCVIGDSGVGKTAMIRRLLDGVFLDQTVSTIGVDFGFFNTRCNGKSIKLQIWDTAGQKRFAPMMPSFVRKSKGVVIAFDPSNKESFDNVADWLQQARKYAPEATFMLLATKADLLATRMVSPAEGAAYATANDMLYAETSAKSGLGLTDFVDSLVEELASRPSLDEPEQPKKNLVALESQPVAAESSVCCSI